MLRLITRWLTGHPTYKVTGEASVGTNTAKLFLLETDSAKYFVTGLRNKNKGPYLNYFENIFQNWTALKFYGSGDVYF